MNNLESRIISLETLGYDTAKASKALQTVLPKKYKVVDKPPDKGKDYNDFLCIKKGIDINKTLTEKSPER